MPSIASNTKTQKTQKAAEQAIPVTAEQEPPRGEGGVPLPGAKRREKGEGAKRLRGMLRTFKRPRSRPCQLQPG